MKKILVSFGLILTLVLCCAFVPVNAAEECAHKEWELVDYLDGEGAPTNCKESRIAKYSCKKCDEVQYKKVYGDHDPEFEVSDLSCTEAQTVTVTCKLCEEVLEVSEVTAALGHTWKEAALEASCERGAGIAQVCTVCGAEKDFVAFEEGSELYAPAKGHKWADKEVVEATCQKGGYTLQECANCKGTQKVNVTEKDPVNGHVGKLVVELKAPGCKTNGVGKYECELCDTPVWYGAIAPEHDWEVVKTITKVTCGTDGKVNLKCKVCKTTSNNVVVPATGEHVMISDTPEGAIFATCTQPDKIGKYCDVCGYEEAKVVPGSEPLGHTWDEAYIPADCDNASGIKKVCEVCDASVFEEFEEGHPLYEAPKGHVAVTVKGYASTCQTKGKTDGSKCEVCGTWITKQKDIAVDKNAHVPVLEKEIKAPGCNTLGVGKYKCAEEKCTVKDLGYKAIPASHSWGEPVADEGKEATCGKEGYGKFTCTVEGCGATKKDVIEATGEHEEEVNIILVCGEPELTVKQCKNCEEILEVLQEGAVVKHNWEVVDGSEEQVIPATCLTPEFVGKVCLNPGCPVGVEVIEVIAPANGHTYDEEFVGASCELPSGIVRFCTVEDCSEYNKVKFEAFEKDHPLYEAPLGHTPKTVKGYAATCSKEGLTDGSVCKVEGCGKVLVKQEKIAINPNAHTKELKERLKDETCTTTGVGKFACKDCKKDLGYGVIEAGHKYGETEAYEGKEPNCGYTGLGVQVCSLCGIEKHDVVMPKVGQHTPAAEKDFVEATCTTPEMIGDKCTTCEIVYNVKAVEGSKPLGHDLKDDFQDAECTTPSGIIITCKNGCDYSEFKPFTAADGDLYVAAIGHKAEKVNAKAATCKETGLTEGSKCKTCQEVLVEQKETPINPNAHTKQLLETLKAETCTKTGVGKYACKDCGKDLGYGVIAAGHKYGDVIAYEGKDATCGQDGLGYKQCTVEGCGYKLENQVIPAKNIPHTPAEDKFFTVDPTCTEPGRAGNICTVCKKDLDKNVIETDPATGHDWNEVPVEADCETAAGIQKTCRTCGAKEFEAFTGELAAPAKGHKLSKVTVAGTCKDKGYTADKCATCKKLFNKVEGAIDPNNHTPEYDPENVLREPTCTKTGVAKATCKDCGKGLGYVAMPAKHSYVETDIANTTGTAVYHECSKCDYIKIIAYFGDKGIKAGDVFKSVEAFEKVENPEAAE